MSKNIEDSVKRIPTPLQKVGEVVKSDLLEGKRISFNKLIKEYTEASKEEVKAQKLREIRLHADKKLLNGIILPEQVRNFYRSQLINIDELSQETQNLLAPEIESYLKRKSIKDILRWVHKNRQARTQIARYLSDLFLDYSTNLSHEFPQKMRQLIQTEGAYSIRTPVVRSVLTKGDADLIIFLGHTNSISLGSLVENVGYARSDENILAVAKLVLDESKLPELFRHIVDPNTIDRFIQSTGEHGALTPHLSENGMSYLLKLKEALEKNQLNTSSIIEEGEFPLVKGRYTNKFVVGMDSTKAEWYIGWSNQIRCSYHRDIFENMEWYDEASFPDDFRSGGYVSVYMDSEKLAKVIFDSSSGDFGLYNDRFLQQHTEALKQVLKTQLGVKEVELVIEISDY